MVRTRSTRITALSRPLVVLALATAGVAPTPAAAQALEARAAPAPAAVKIRDNLFLLEEAYNQEPGVIQHIQAYQLNPRTGAFSYSFTEEWPVPDDRHQLSVTLPLSNAGAGPAALGDVLVNYRLQALGVGGQGAVAFAPRLSLLLPSGDSRTGAGRGVLGVQTNLPLSVELGSYLVAHLNAGLTVTPGAKSPGGASATAVDTSAGVALVWLPLEWANGLVELAHVSSVAVDDDGATARTHAFVVNPGVRFALTFDSGLQVVPGLSAPVQLSASGVDVSVLAYLSLEHPLWSP